MNRDPFLRLALIACCSAYMLGVFVVWDPDRNGEVRISGDVRGGHEFEVYGYDPQTDLVWCFNSWGKGWGRGGRFCMTTATWGELLVAQGDVTVPVRA